MGYTHYWKLNHEGSEENLQKALHDIRKIIHVRRSMLAGGMGKKDTKPEYKEHVSINGIDDGKTDNSHETFQLPASFKPSAAEKVEGILVLRKQMPGDDGSFRFDFCKTAMKPYDEIVTACLAVLAMHMGKDVKVSSDGQPEDWEAGIKLAEMVLCVKVPNPIKDNEDSEALE